MGTMLTITAKGQVTIRKEVLRHLGVAPGDWVLQRAYSRESGEIAAVIRHLADSASVRVDRPAVDAGLAVLEAGGAFADGVIAFEGRRLGGTVFTSFDRRAVELIAATGAETCLLSTA